MKTLIYTTALLFSIIALSCGSLSAVSIDSTQNDNEVEKMLKLADEKHMSGDEMESLQIYGEVLERDANNLQALWNSAVLYAKMGYRKDDEEKKRECYEKAMKMAENAKKYHSDNGHSYYAYAVALGRMTTIMDTNDRIEASHEVKTNIQKAVEMMPEFAPAWHLFGVWHSDVANVSPVVKAATGLFSEGLPDASNEKAEEYLEKAVKMEPENILFNLDLAKHLLEVDKDQRAKEVLEKITGLEPKMKDDPSYKKEAKKLLSELE